MLITALLILIFVFVLYNEYIRNWSSCNANQKYSSQLLVESAQAFLRELKMSTHKSYSIFRIDDVRRYGPRLKVKCFVCNNSEFVVNRYEYTARIPLFKYGAVEIHNYSLKE